MLGKLWGKRGARTILLAMLLAGLGSASVEAGGYISEGLEEPAQGGRQVLMYLEEEEAHIPSEFGRIYVNKDSRTMVPIRFISESLGHEVEWDGKARTVVIDNGDIKMPIGSRKPFVNGETKTMDTEAVLVGQRTYVPLRFISENLGYEVLYGRDNSLNAVFIYKDTKPSEAILRAYINNVVDLDRWKLSKDGGESQESLENNLSKDEWASKYKDFLAEDSRRLEIYLPDSKGYRSVRKFYQKKDASHWDVEYIDFVNLLGKSNPQMVIYNTGIYSYDSKMYIYDIVDGKVDLVYSFITKLTRNGPEEDISLMKSYISNDYKSLYFTGFDEEDKPSLFQVAYKDNLGNFQIEKKREIRKDDVYSDYSKASGLDIFTNYKKDRYPTKFPVNIIDIYDLSRPKQEPYIYIYVDDKSVDNLISNYK